ncbi:MAG TPA: DUF5939 domain-containing protein [Pyrinomonadaceae bacterium]|nr:DUF5939 domain-containing protein [Pyrinomonadaceae bacterium]
MSDKEFKRRWEYDLRSEPEALWPFVADTNRFNRDVGLPSLVDFDEASANGTGAQVSGANARRRLRLRYAGVEVRWEEEPFEWVRPYGFRVVRRYESGPVSELRVSVELKRRAAGGTRLIYSIEACARKALWRVAVPLQLNFAARKFANTFRRYDESARRAQEQRKVAAPPALSAASQLTEAARARLRSTAERLIERGADTRLVERLAELVERGDEMSVSHLRPYALADAWEAARREVLELCLLATREGVLDLRWDVLCPLCRGTQQSSDALRDVEANLHCATCNVDFTANFDRSVEVTFRPNASLRTVEEREFCVGGPELTPHVVVQQLLAPGESRAVAPVLEEGRYRLRTLSLPGARSLVVTAEGGVTEATLRADSSAWPADEPRLAPAPALRFENATSDEQLFILERAAWSDDAATAAEVTALQMFRDLFAEEALRPGDRITVGSLTLVFTDLRDSTRLYRQIGDAVAFGAVMNHFDVLRECIAAEGGAIVKTLGDAVMAAFVRPSAALRAVVRAQRTLASPPAGIRPLLLKAGIHTGACIAVTLNGRLDYFGSNVNIAARLEPLSTGRDLVISDAVRRDPAVARLLSEEDLAVRPLETSLKGFDEETFQLWRVERRTGN